MKEAGPSNSWELKTREILRSVLPEYDIDPHMRLSNVVSGRIRVTQQMAMYEIDFCVREKISGAVICAIELDGWQHGTQEGQRKDANKNRWLDEAGIMIIRIKKPEDAINIRQRMKEKKHARKADKHFGRYIASVLMTIVFIGALMWVLNVEIKKIFSNMGTKIVAQQQQDIEQQQRSRQLFLDAQAASSAVQKQEAEQAEVRRRVEATQPHYEQILVKAKSSRECRKDNVITNESIKCMKDHYEMVLVSGNQ